MKKLEIVPLSKEFLINRGSCCSNKCLNCPYIPKWEKGNKKLKS